MATETEERDPVPSYVLVHYLKEDAPTHPEVMPPIIIQDHVPPAAQNLDEDEDEEVQGSLFAGFHLRCEQPLPPASSSLALKKRNLDEAGMDFLDDPSTREGRLERRRSGGAAASRFRRVRTRPTLTALLQRCSHSRGSEPTGGSAGRSWCVRGESDSVQYTQTRLIGAAQESRVLRVGRTT